jgi:hypothetical protein
VLQFLQWLSGERKDQMLRSGFKFRAAGVAGQCLCLFAGEPVNKGSQPVVVAYVLGSTRVAIIAVEDITGGGTDAEAEMIAQAEAALDAWVADQERQEKAARKAERKSGITGGASRSGRRSPKAVRRLKDTTAFAPPTRSAERRKRRRSSAGIRVIDHS